MLIQDLTTFRLATPNVVAYSRQSEELEACPTFLMIVGHYFAPAFRGGARNEKFA